MKCYISSGEYHVVIDAMSMNHAVYEAFFRLHEKKKLPRLSKSTYVGFRGFAVDRRKWQIPTKEILESVNLLKRYRMERKT